MSVLAPGGTITHGHGALAATAVETLPNNADASSPCPRDLITTSSDRSSSEIETMQAAVDPTVVRSREPERPVSCASRSRSRSPSWSSASRRRSASAAAVPKPGAADVGSSTCTRTISRRSLLASPPATASARRAPSLSSRQHTIGPINVAYPAVEWRKRCAKADRNTLQLSQIKGDDVPKKALLLGGTPLVDDRG
jgi:hypothetical protein